MQTSSFEKGICLYSLFVVFGIAISPQNDYVEAVVPATTVCVLAV